MKQFVTQLPLNNEKERERERERESSTLLDMNSELIPCRIIRQKETEKELIE